MADFLNRMLGRNSSEEKGSGATAKDRLKMVLTHDRIQVSPEKLKEMRAEIISVIAKYVPEIDPDSVDISIEQTDRYNNRIVAQIPFTKTRGKAVPDSEENADLQETVDIEATTLPHIKDDEVEEKAATAFKTDDDEDTVMLDAPEKVDDETTVKSKLADADKISKLDTTTAETDSDDASDASDGSDDSDSSDD